jgi:membrane protein
VGSPATTTSPAPDAALGDPPAIRHALRPLHLRVWWALRDYAKRVWDNSGEDNIFFLAGGIAFNILLAAVPFFLLLVSGLAFFLNHSLDVSRGEVYAFVDRFLPPHGEGPDSPIHGLLDDVIAKAGSVGFYSAIGFVWFTTRLFGSLRSVLADVFDIDQERGIIKGKIFDIQITIVSTLIFVAYTALSAYLAIATTRGVQVLVDVGIRSDVMGGLEYVFGRFVAFCVFVLMFFSLYKFLPNRKIRWKTAMLAALFTGVMFELARGIFTTYVRSFNPGSLYTGTLAAIIIIVFWVYYAAMLFILGGEIAQVYELRRVRRLQRETFEE